jgi:hypothetical protein
MRQRLIVDLEQVRRLRAKCEEAEMNFATRRCHDRGGARRGGSAAVEETMSAAKGFGAAVSPWAAVMKVEGGVAARLW